MPPQPDIKPNTNLHHGIEGNEGKKIPAWKLILALAAVFAVSAGIYWIVQLIK